MSIEERALNYLRQGWGSRASVLRALLDDFGFAFDEHTLKLICLALDPFHAPSASLYTDRGKYGITVCGALSGALAAFNLITASVDLLPYEFWTEGMKEGGWIKRMIDEGWPLEKKIEAYIKACEKYGYGAHYEMVKRFYERFGTTDCLELEQMVGDPVSYECFKNCAKVVIWTAAMAKDVISAFRKEPSRFRIGKGNVQFQFLKE
ncbi:MAG: C_GCAxxG_C_C family protein [Deferribacteres bacterium]|nr:C_GCAxxG_C_C family protein [Deferribacteres bacterium]